ncbi:MAG: DUF3488 and transglutaminase-like domain-containing protein [Xanthomonadaceae bacterium]|nr:DUF3488 and transglutaminase-like domain-containing protein [Xanthomonadaceae bacterium]
MRAHIATEHLESDRLLWVLICLGVVLAPHILRLPVWITALFVVLALWRVGAAHMRWRMPPAWVRALFAVAGVAAVGLEFRAWGGQEAGTAMLVVMLSLKLTETVRKRDGMILVMIGYILVIANFLYSQTILTGLYMVGAVWLNTATLLHITHPTTGIAPRERFRQAGALLLQALPIAALLFVLFPRVPGPLWGVPAGQDAVTGLSDRMEPGAIAALSQSNAVAFRVTFDEEEPPTRQLYWRGPVLRSFDGRAWEQGAEPAPDGFNYEALSPAVSYEVSLEPHRYRWMFTLDLPAETPDNAIVTRAFQVLHERPVRERILYRMRSHLEYRTGPDANLFERHRSTQLPRTGNPRARALAQRLADEHDDPRALLGAMLMMFRNEPYFYTLSPPALGANPVDGFLFDTRRGFCEHYAGSLAFVARAAGIPARVVLGYHGGELNPVGNYLIVRQSDAHAWVEVYFEDEGWVRVDPTGAVAPQRIERGADALGEEEGRNPGVMRGIPVLNRLRLQWDDMNNRWNQFVLGYDRDQQQRLLERLGFENADYRTLVILLFLAVAAAMALLVAWLVRHARPSRPRDPAVRLYLALQRRLTKRGLAPRALHEGPRDFGERAAAADAEAADAVHAFIDAYLRYRYGRAGSGADLAEMRTAVRAIR